MFKKPEEGNPDQKLEPIKSADEQSTNENAIVGYIKTKVEESRANPARVAWESNTLTNSAYLTGLDSVYFDSRARAFRPISGNQMPSKNRVHANLILPTINNRLAMLLKNPPKYDTYPNTTSPEDKDGARLSLRLINNKWDTENLDEKRIELGMWQQQGGHGWMKVGWNDCKGDPLPDVRDPDPLTGELVGEPEVNYEGDIDIEVCSPFEVFCDPLAKSQAEMEWLIHAKVRKLSYFRDRYERGAAVKQEGAWLLSIQNMLKINNMSSKSSAGSLDESVMQNSAIELAYFEKPSKKYPNGRMIICANGVLLKYGDLPAKMIPYVKFDDVKIAGKFFSESLITHLRPIQDQYNRNLRKKAEYINKGLALKILAAKGSGLTQESLNDSTEVIEYNPMEQASPPKDMPSPQMPQYVFSEDANLKEQFSEISGVSQVSKGQLPSASIPGIGMELLQEADSSRIGIITTSNENSWALVGQLIVRYACKYYITRRFLKECGEDGEYNYTEFTGADLRESWDVRVVRGSTLPHSKSQNRQDMFNLLDRGLLGDPNDPIVKQKMLSRIEYGDAQDVWEDLRVDMQQIKKSIESIESLVPPIVDPDDNHLLHFNEKNRLRKTPKFDQYQPPVKQLFLQNLAEHKQYLMPPQIDPVTGLPLPPGPPMPPQGLMTEEPMPPPMPEDQPPVMM